MAPPIWTIGQILANFDRDSRAWIPATNIPYRFYSALPASYGADPDYAGFGTFNAAAISAAKLALALYADIANVSFVASADTTTRANLSPAITYANSSTMPNGIWGWNIGWYIPDPGPARDKLVGGEVWVNTK